MADETATGWAAMPLWILDSTGVGASSKFVALLVYNDPGKTPEDYAADQSITVEAVRAGLNELFAAGMIEVREKRPYPKAMMVGISEGE